MTGPAAAAPESASTREKILGAAYRTLVEVGYTQISMRKIAEGAGVNQSLLHYYYGSKENLMLEVLDFVNERLLVRQRTMYAEAGSFEQIWAQALEYFKRDVRSGYVRALWELRGQALSNARIQTRVTQMIAHWRRLVTGLSRQALAQYGIAGQADPEVLGRVIGDLYWGAEAEILAGEDAEAHFEAIHLMGNLFRWLARDQHAPKIETEVSEMDLKQLSLKKGTWVVANCGKFPSEKNCQLVLMAPQSQRQDLIEAAATHAVKTHGHTNTPDLRKELGQMLDTVDI